jgi:glutamate formiminotransferase
MNKSIFHININKWSWHKMSKIIECVPNFSEGQRQEVLEEIISSIKLIEGVRLLDKEADPDHNRAVITFIGEPEKVVQAAFNAVQKAAELIDMEQHKGEHPRMGATDVVPFIPISGATMADCVKLAQELGKEIGDKLKIPVYLYGEAASVDFPERKNLAIVRKGQYEGLKEVIGMDPSRKPDYGPAKMHPKAGATAVGARMPLIAYNVNLNTTDLELAKMIAKSIREKDGGFPYVKAMGFDIHDKGIVQVSMNLTNYLETPIYDVFNEIKRHCDEHNIEILESELIGLAPMDALLETSIKYLKLKTFKPDQVLENRLMDL